jgi:hypothetical protein
MLKESSKWRSVLALTLIWLMKALAATVTNGNLVCQRSKFWSSVRNFAAWCIQWIPPLRHKIEMGPRGVMMRYEFHPNSICLIQISSTLVLSSRSRRWCLYSADSCLAAWQPYLFRRRNFRKGQESAFPIDCLGRLSRRSTHAGERCQSR